MEIYQNLFLILAIFTIICLASLRFGDIFVKVKLPLITGFLFAGIVMGPFGFEFLTFSAVKDLYFLDQMSLAFIAFAAGGELYLKDLTKRFKSIKWVTIGLVTSTFTIGSIAVFYLAQYIPFMQQMPESQRVAIAILAGSILVARSPSSAIAVIKELRAKGPFIQTALGVTVIMDAVVIIVFAFNASIADAILSSVSLNFSFVFLLIAEMILTVIIGYLVGKILQFILSLKIDILIKSTVILLLGYGVFVFSDQLHYYSGQHYSFEIVVEPLLICMIASCLTANYSSWRNDFLVVLHKVSPTIYLIFFTLTGASLNIGVLADLWLIATVLFFVRIVAIFIGSTAGGLIAGDPLKRNVMSWMAYITQAGIGIGLARGVANKFPDWGVSFATLMIAVIVINQIVGPSLFKLVIYLLKEQGKKAKKTDANIIHNVIIFGNGGQAVTLAHQLSAHDWQVRLLTFNYDNLVKNINIDEEIEIVAIDDINLKELSKLRMEEVGTVVTMLEDDKNYQICKLIYDNFGNINLIAKLSKRKDYKRFLAINTMIVAPSTAIISLLDHFVRSPSVTSALLDSQEDQEIIDIKLTNPSLAGQTLSQLSLPKKILVINVYRDGTMFNIYKDFQFQLDDVVTITGPILELQKIDKLFSAEDYTGSMPSLPNL